MKAYSIFPLWLCYLASLDAEKSKIFKKQYFVGNPDDTAEIYRPCPVYDLHCIRNFFADHSQCQIATGPLPDPLYRSQMTIYFGRVNLTVTLNDVMVTSLNNARVEELYVNKASNNLVFAVEFRNLSYTSPASYFQFKRKAREPIVAVAPAGINFGPVTFTGVIPNIMNLELDHLEVSPYALSGVRAFLIGPQVARSPDPAVVNTLAEFLMELPVDVQEDLYTEGLFYLPAYIQYNICDFGLNLL